MNYKYLENNLQKKEKWKKRELKIDRNSYGVATANIDQYIKEFERILEQIKNSAALTNIDLWVKELIVQTETIIQDYNNNIGYANIHPKEAYSVDVYKCYRYFTVYMRAYGKFLYCLFYKSNSAEIYCERYSLSRVKKYFHDKCDYKSEYLFSELFNMLFKFITLVCENDWVSSYMYLMYKHRNDRKISSMLINLPDFRSLRQSVTENLKMDMRKVQPFEYVIQNSIYYTLQMMNKLCYNKILHYNTTFYDSTLKKYRQEFKGIYLTMYFIYNGTPMVSFNYKSIPVAFWRESFEESIGFKLNNHDTEIFDNMIENLSDYLNDVLVNIKSKSITDKIFIQFRIIENQNIKLLMLGLCDNIISLPVFTLDIDSSIFKNGIYCKILNLIGKALSYDFKSINSFCMAAAMCLMRENTAKKLIIIKAAADNYEYSPWRQFIDIKDFSNEIPIYVNEKNYYWDIPLEKLCTDSMLKKLKRLQLSGLKCLTVKKANRKLLKKERDILMDITHHTNVQIIVLQNDANIDKFAIKDYVYLDLSKLTLPDNYSAYREDYAWARVYLSAYGLHCINKAKRNSDELYSETAKIFNNKNKKKLAEKSDISLKEFTDKFVEQYFVTTSEAQNRKRERTLEANRLKRKYNNLTNDEAERIITQELSDKPLYATYKEDFLMYAESYIKCSLSEKKAENMGINAKNMMKQLKNGGKYIYGELKPMYTGRKRGYGFQNLSLKKPWQYDLEEKDIDTPVQESFDDTDHNGAEKMQKFAELLYKRINIS